ncbi:MAG TPA: bifunctional DNA primase/polymerase [Actinocrinis sp.]|uniref:bifunctional DNA primase/polymerase n=1 Tax=Actinocrinis sp. TaxID=1920516 RepID=UPI002DDCEB98|nr:bifunctional DNA primase/polymerase [Actinocrinis sp.]HEV2343251.1 bifunctional DNA primase/polymerase [Actinocrinis sp.]
MRGRGQLGTLGTLLPHQAGRLRPAADPRADTAPNQGKNSSNADKPGADRAERTERADRPRRAGRSVTAVVGRSTALRYAAWGWPVAPSAAIPATTDLEQVFATWSRLPDAPILAACGEAFDVIEADASAGRNALARLDRLGVELGPVTIDSVAGPGSGLGAGAWVSAGARSSGRIGFLVRADSAAPLSALIDRNTGPVLIGRGAAFELPRALDQSEPFRPTMPTGRYWLRPPGTPRPVLPTAHVVLGALALVPYRALAASPLPR